MEEVPCAMCRYDDGYAVSTRAWEVMEEVLRHQLWEVMEEVLRHQLWEKETERFPGESRQSLWFRWLFLFVARFWLDIIL